MKETKLTTVHAIVTRHDSVEMRHDIPGEQVAAELEARERHGREHGVPTDDVVVEHLGATQQIVTIHDLMNQLENPNGAAISQWLERREQRWNKAREIVAAQNPPYTLTLLTERRDDNGLRMPAGWGGGTEVTLHHIIPAATNGGTIGWVEERAPNEWQGRRSDYDRTGPVRDVQHDAVLDVFTNWLIAPGA